MMEKVPVSAYWQKNLDVFMLGEATQKRYGFTRSLMIRM